MSSKVLHAIARESLPVLRKPRRAASVPVRNEAQILTERFFETVIAFEPEVDSSGGLADSAELQDGVALIKEFIANGARPEPVLARLAERKSEKAHLLANLIRHQANLRTKSPRDLVLSSLTHRKHSAALCPSETIYLKRSGFLDEVRGGLSEKGLQEFTGDKAVMTAHAGHRRFKKPQSPIQARIGWMKFCPI